MHRVCAGGSQSFFFLSFSLENRKISYFKSSFSWQQHQHDKDIFIDSTSRTAVPKMRKKRRIFFVLFFARADEAYAPQCNWTGWLCALTSSGCVSLSVWLCVTVSVCVRSILFFSLHLFCPPLWPCIVMRTFYCVGTEPRKKWKRKKTRKNVSHQCGAQRVRERQNPNRMRWLAAMRMRMERVRSAAMCVCVCFFSHLMTRTKKCSTTMRCRTHIYGG